MDTLSEDDTSLFKSIVDSQFRRVLSEKGGLPTSELDDLSIDDYHTVAHLVDHANLWGKTSRLLAGNEYDAFLKSDFFKSMKEELGEVIISDEQNFGCPQIYWRLVRPDQSGDVGPLHADGWFWDLNDWQLPKGYKRLKFWFSLWNEPGKSGFRYVPHSHLQEYEYGNEMRHGTKKPVFDETEHDLDIQKFMSGAGEYIAFHDMLLHGGFVGGTKTRVSFEFTLFVKDDYVQKSLQFDEAPVKKEHC